MSMAFVLEFGFIDHLYTQDSTSRFLTTDFNTGTITVLLNYTLHIQYRT
jgi:hypothetical protein